MTRRGRLGTGDPEAWRRRAHARRRLVRLAVARRPDARDAGREASAKSYRGLGWFDRMPHTATGAVAARSLTYWFRDARYWVSIIMVPIVPVLVDVPLGHRGHPAVVHRPDPGASCACLGWSLHNDTAYDSTAVWLHVASSVRGAADRRADWCRCSSRACS